ncbi:MAG: CapA family protein [Flavobacteriaceae bacterium]
MYNGITIMLSGDVMTGRGIDQILPHPSDPTLFESYIKDARDYVKLAERVNGAIDGPVGFDYIWGDLLGPMKAADLRIINLETSITTSDAHLDKGINYRMHPKNIPCLLSGQIDCCVIANNHILDWGHEGLLETLESLEKTGMAHSGAGHDIERARAPARLKTNEKGKVLVFTYGLASSGIPNEWQATKDRPGINLINGLSRATINQIGAEITQSKKTGDIVIASIHWGGNWGYDVPQNHIDFAHDLIDLAGVDIVHGHSSHHPLGIEVYHSKPILYGCGDLLNDYEGISGHETYRANLGFLYFITVDISEGHLVFLEMAPTEVKKFQLVHPNEKDRKWLQQLLDREGERFGTRTAWKGNGLLSLIWD